MKLSTFYSVFISAITVSAMTLQEHDGLAIERRAAKESTTTAVSSARTTPSDLSGAQVVVGAVVAPLSVSGNGQGVANNGSANGNVAISGAGSTGNYSGPGSIASAAGSASGSGYNTAIAIAASAAAIVNPNATNVRLTSTSFTNSTTFKSPLGTVTISYAESHSTAEDAQGDYATYWSYVTSISSPLGNYTHGNHGGSHRGQANGTAQYSNASATVSAGTASVTAGISDPGPPFTYGPGVGVPHAASFEKTATDGPVAQGVLGIDALAPGGGYGLINGANSGPYSNEASVGITVSP